MRINEIQGSKLNNFLFQWASYYKILMHMRACIKPHVNYDRKYRDRFVTEKFDIFNFFSLVILDFTGNPDHTKKLISITCIQK